MVRPTSGSFAERLIAKSRAFYDLTKPRIAGLILIVAAASFYLASPGSVDLGRLALAVVGTAMLAAGIFALNHYVERDVDRLMKRTADRPLPSGRLNPGEALLFGSVLTGASILFFTLLLSPLCGLLAFATFVSYIFVYTPLKRVTPYHTPLGAISGAMPPLLGWASARGSLSVEAWVLFGILFFWQFPHFLSIEMMYKEDYTRAQMRVLPVVDPSWRKVGIELVSALVLLLLTSLIPYIAGRAGLVYLIGATLFGIGFFIAGIVAVTAKRKMASRRLLLASVLYLPLVFLLLVLNVK